ncbi:MULTISPECIES: NAD(P)H-dependent oxidoreductase [unclassified Polaromonas]|uniref:NAD(P)H-dependent oxidoreductase n=1 Tax=unclassified Polaromonas TaxID=2638319 RepID=UPI0018CA5A4F|nr:MULTISPECIES: NAD(P)-dependent oxidoreductase [unclassified Polaromonas]MBG6070308.1 putative homoserine dehydrogenase-like protein [Polaromonas sp. CG_9.7]MBG6112306.1 putative homoserine dehydrogenase-like protein [Polaromonas sp. CG_9.2]MDH6183952.1 putative homoserine dehydrogenase-like protein [Polaromonas sp. CG_23.6]
MIIVDTALAQRAREGRPIRVGLIGAGFMARGVALQIALSVPGMRVAAIANRTLEGARRAYREADVSGVCVVETVTQLERAIESGVPAITEDAMLLCRAAGIDAIIEVTGTIEHAAHVTLEAIAHRKHVVLMNAEIDGTIGPILKTYADRAGVVLTTADGDQPGVMMNLYRFVKGIGVKPVMCGNIKGLHDPYRNPTTQEGFARQWGQNPAMVTSFADGTKISFENAIVANGTGMRVGQRGMYGPTVAPGTPIQEVAERYPLEAMIEGPGIVDYVVGAMPGPGVFVLGTHDHPQQKHYLSLYKLGNGPLYCFYTPYHLCHFEVPNTVARAVLFQDAALSPLGAPCVEVLATAKIDLKAGESIDGLGGYMTYGLAENADTARSQNLLPIGLAEGCTLKRDVPKDALLTFDDVELPQNRLCDQLWREQMARFFPEYSETSSGENK